MVFVILSSVTQIPIKLVRVEKFGCALHLISEIEGPAKFQAATNGESKLGCQFDDSLLSWYSMS